MRPSRKKRAFFALFCTVCQEEQGKRRENYKIMLNPTNTNPKEFTARKFCNTCKKHRIHKTKQISRSQN
ncbi:MAG: 50S ribosomal protein L33 [Candidatus Peregrinibacteria bacterium]|nr:50S ribosomal protein L33 [Candidatus Peregrinibacteria bacterium]